MAKQRVNSFACKIRSSQLSLFLCTFVAACSLQSKCNWKKRHKPPPLFKSPPDLTTPATTTTTATATATATATSVVTPSSSCTLVTGTLFLFHLSLSLSLSLSLFLSFSWPSFSSSLAFFSMCTCSFLLVDGVQLSVWCKLLNSVARKLSKQSDKTHFKNCVKDNYILLSKF